MAVAPGESEAKVKAHIDGGEFRSAYDLLAPRRDLSPREAFYLAYCFTKLQPGELREAIELFDTAEAQGFADYWLSYNRSQLLAASGNHARALDDALKVLASNPLPETIDLAVRSLSAITSSDPAAPVANSALAVSTLLSAIWKRVRDLQSQIEVIHRKIVNVNKGDFDAFVYQGDLSATPTPTVKMLPASPLGARQFIASWERSTDVLLLLVAWYVVEGIPTAFLDIGSNIGSDAIRVAKFSRLINEQLPITSFEPGIMASLVPYNLKLNGVENIVAFEEKCVSDNNKPAVLFGEAALSVNNRIVNRTPGTEAFSKIVDSVTVSEHLSQSKFENRHPVLKIDTQGAEWLIWNGMKQDISRRSFSMVMELTPWALTPMVQTTRFVDELLESFYVVDLGNGRQRFAPITRENRDERILYVQRNAPYWTDLLCVARSLPSARQLIDRIAGAYGASGPETHAGG